MITSPKQDMPNKLAGSFPLSHLHNRTEEIEMHFPSPNVFKENHEVLGKNPLTTDW